MSREIKILVDTDGNGNVQASMSYNYTVSGNYVDTTNQGNVYSINVSLYDGATAETELEGLYVYFNPINTTGTDTIQIENNVSGNLDVYLVQMQGDGVARTLHVIETRPDDTVTRICTNMESTDYNMGQGYNSVEITTLGPTREVVSLYNVEIEVYKKDKLIQTYTGSLRNQED